MTERNYYQKITAHSKPWQLNLGELWRYRDLVWLWTRRLLVLSYKQTVLGPLWVVLTPLLSSVLYAFVFGGIAGLETDGVPHVLFYLCTGALWSFFSAGLTKNAAVFRDNAQLFGKVYFPRLTVPVANILGAAVQFGLQLLPAAIFLTYYVVTGAVTPNWWALPLIPVILVQVGLLSLGCGLLIAALTVKYRDLQILVTFGVQLWMFATPVVYPLSAVGTANLRSLLLLNPMTAPMELLRFCLLGRGAVLPWGLAVSACVTILLAAVGMLAFRRAERTFLDTV